MTFEGVYTPVLTPFTTDHSLDLKAWAEVIEYQIEAGIHGIVVGGSTGEFYALSATERVEQFQAATKIINGRVPWLAGVNEFTTDKVCSYAVAARDAGAYGLLLAPPPYALPNDEELVAHCLQVDRAGRLPIMLYSYPARTGVALGETFLRQISASSRFRGIKESGGDVKRIHLISREFPHIELSCGADDLALEFFVWGARSWVAGATNCLPKELLALYDVCTRRRDFVLGRRIMSALMPFITLLERDGRFIQCVKFASEVEGRPGGEPRQPLRPIKGELKHELAEAIATAKDNVRLALAQEVRDA